VNRKDDKMRIDLLIATIGAGVSFGQAFGNTWLGIGVVFATYALMPTDQ
jgi:hypothetical protein